MLPVPGVHPSKRVLGTSAPFSTASAEAEPCWHRGVAVKCSGGTEGGWGRGVGAWCRGASRQPPRHTAQQEERWELRNVLVQRLQLPAGCRAPHPRFF